MDERQGQVGPETALRPLDAIEPRAAVDAVVTAAYAAHRVELFSFLFSGVRDRDVAEDLLQDVFVRFMRQVGSGQAPLNTRGWLYRVASNLVISRGRRLSVAARWLSRATNPDPIEAADSRVLRRERADDLEVMLGRLAPDARTAILLQGHGFSGPEIAAAIGRTDGATRTLLCRARVRLRLLLESEEAAR